MISTFHPILYYSTRVSNELGAGQPQSARLALLVAVVVALSEGTCIGIVTILARHVWGKLFSNEKEVIKYVAKIMPLLALSDFLDGFQCVLSGNNFFKQVFEFKLSLFLGLSYGNAMLN